MQIAVNMTMSMSMTAMERIDYEHGNATAILMMIMVVMCNKEVCLFTADAHTPPASPHPHTYTLSLYN